MLTGIELHICSARCCTYPLINRHFFGVWVMKTGFFLSETESTPTSRSSRDLARLRRFAERRLEALIPPIPQNLEPCEERRRYEQKEEGNKTSHRYPPPAETHTNMACNTGKNEQERQNDQVISFITVRRWYKTADWRVFKPALCFKHPPLFSSLQRGGLIFDGGFKNYR